MDSSSKSKKPVSVKESNSKTDTRYYDELFTRIREDEEFQDAESFGKINLFIFNQ